MNMMSLVCVIYVNYFQSYFQFNEIIISIYRIRKNVSILFVHHYQFVFNIEMVKEIDIDISIKSFLLFLYNIFEILYEFNTLSLIIFFL